MTRTRILFRSGLVCLCLAATKSAGGFWTPATVMGDGLIERLVKHAGVTFELVE